MSGKRHNNQPGKLFLAMLFLLINIVCAASPVLGFEAADFKNAVPTRVGQVPDSPEAGIEIHVSVSSFANHLSQSAFRRQNHVAASKKVDGETVFSTGANDLPRSFAAKVLPTPGYYGFLFRYKLF